MTGLHFEWDEAKDLANQRKHGVSFTQASQVFDDPFYVSAPERMEENEQRWQTFGRVNDVPLLMVAHTVREEDGDGEQIEIIRIITARRANAREIKRYENEDR